ncbi:MAG: carbohydrate binding family 9 domain-containing protein [Gemmatimonadetes bacterium]|nr:carbohydrate binding family 9 domain-containing protein [Gemmatimonadota bacterium]
MIVLLAAALAVGPQDTARVAEPPRLETAEVRVDGRLDEEVWAGAALLGSFTQSRPAEGTPASERTEVRVFYTPRDLYIGVRAYAADPSRIRATLAERDQITSDDHIRLLLDTFGDQRRAFIFFVNPLGIQQDGILAEGRGNDYAPDFLFDSRGRLTGDGYEVELRIPLKSLKFPAGDEQRWGFNVIRVIPATSALESWAPRAQTAASELAQNGTLRGIRGLRPGRLFEANPTLTARREGSTGEDGFRRGPTEPDVGVNVKYGITSELTLDATVNPDFSTVEADADQITVNERFAISLQEKRPFFLEGADLFSTPETLVYTRAVVDPAVGARLTGKVGALNLAYLGAVDEAPLSRPARFAPRGERAVFHIARVRRDVGSEGSTLGALATSRQTGDAFNHVAAADARIRFGGVYVLGAQGGGSWTRSWIPDPLGADSAGAPGSRQPVSTDDQVGHIAHLFLDRTGRRWGFLAAVRDVPSSFRTETGFVRRRGVTEFFGGNRVSWYGEQGAFLQRLNLRQGFRRIYGERDFWRGDEAVEGSLSVEAQAELRGNLEVEVGVERAFYTLDLADYAGFSRPGPDGRPQTGDSLVGPDPRVGGLHGISLQVESSYFKTADLGVEMFVGGTPIFAEGTRGVETGIGAEVALRPTRSLRVDGSVGFSVLHRASDDSRYSRALVPRLRVEYQLTRALAVRGLAQYSVEEVDVLRAPDGGEYLRGGEPFRLRRGNLPSYLEPQLNPLRLDVLLSYRPSPGTVAFLGYGREVTDDEAFRFGGFQPRVDGLFFKVSYLFRR